MAESHEENIDLLTGVLFGLHMELRDILLSLPIPLTIPSTMGLSEVQLLPVMRSVQRAPELIADEPIPEAVATILADVLNLWNTAAITTATAQVNEGDPFFTAAGVVLGHIESGVRFVIQLLGTLPEADE